MSKERTTGGVGLYRHRHKRRPGSSGNEEIEPRGTRRTRKSCDAGGCDDLPGEALSITRGTRETGGKAKRSEGGWFDTSGQDTQGLADGRGGSDANSRRRRVGSSTRAETESEGTGSGVGDDSSGGGEDGRGEEGGGEEEGGGWGALFPDAEGRRSSLMLSFERGRNSDMVQCVIVRDVSGPYK